jgi:hypothetical protein
MFDGSLNPKSLMQMFENVKVSKICLNNTEALQVTWALISKNYLNKTEALREVFFCEDSEPSQLQHLQSLFNAYCPESRLVDLRRLRVCCSSSIPTLRVSVDSSAYYIEREPMIDYRVHSYASSSSLN